MAEILFDFITSPDDQRPNIIGRGILPVGGKLILGGGTKTNKSFVALNIALALVRGTHLFGAHYPNGTPVFPVTKSWKVLLLEQEIGRQGLKNRLRQLTTEERALGDELHIVSKDARHKLDSLEGLKLIEEQVELVKPDLVIFDPFSKYHNSDENSAQEMGRVMRTVDSLSQKFGCATMFVHHTGLAVFQKDNMREGGNTLRGSSAIFADVDTYVGLKRLSAVSNPEPILDVSFELRQGEPIPTQRLVKRRSGVIQWKFEVNSAEARDESIAAAAGTF